MTSQIMRLRLLYENPHRRRIARNHALFVSINCLKRDYDPDEDLDTPLPKDGISTIGNIGYPVTIRDLGIDDAGFVFAEEVAKRVSRAPPIKEDLPETESYDTSQAEENRLSDQS